jgi:hypothetical protein
VGLQKKQKTKNQKKPTRMRKQIKVRQFSYKNGRRWGGEKEKQ